MKFKICNSKRKKNQPITIANRYSLLYLFSVVYLSHLLYRIYGSEVARSRLHV